MMMMKRGNNNGYSNNTILFIVGSTLLTLLIAMMTTLPSSSMLVEAVDASKFKQCHDLSFCTRNRNLDKDAHRIEVVEGTIKVSGTSITADLIDKGTVDRFPDHFLALEINIVKDTGILRMRVNEKTPLPGKKRYQVKDVLLENQIVYQSLSSSDLEYGTDSGQGKYAKLSYGDNSQVRIYFTPFRLDIFVNGELAMTSNQRGLFNFEHMRSKPLPPQPVTNPAEENDENNNNNAETTPVSPMDPQGTWEENFQSHHDSKPNGPMSIGLDISFVDTKHVYGIPEHSTALSLRSTKGEGINEQPYRLYNLDVFEYELDKTAALYGAIPFMVSHDLKKTVGVFWLNAAETFIDLSDGKSSQGKPTKDTHWMSETGIMDVFYLSGPTIPKLYSQYALLTGTTALPQLFSLAYHQCRWNYNSQDDVKNVDKGFDDNNIPYDVLWLDIEHTDGKRYFTWDKNNFPTPDEMQNALAAKSRKMVTIVDPHIKRDQGYYIHQEAQNKGFYIKNRDGNDFDGHCWPGSSSYPDFTNKEVRDWWSSQFAYDKYQKSTPSLYIWNDMNEPSVFSGPEVSMPKDNLHLGGVEHRDVHNVYGMYYHMASTQGLVDRNKDKNDRPFVLSRAFFAGSQRIGAIWTGDNAAQWSHLKVSNPMLLSLGVAGLTFVGADVGGFFGNPDGELVARWYQTGAFQPFFRGHAHLDTRRREPWLFGEPYTTVIKNAIVKRYSYLPLWYTLFHENTLTGLPVMRPLWMEFPTQESLFATEDQYMVGSSLLVSPVFEQGTKSIKLTLPGDSKQTWYDIDTDKRYYASMIEVDTPLDKIPVYQKGGSIISKKDRPRRSSSQMINDPYTLRVALDNDQKAVGTLYSDDEHSFNYQKGEYVYRQFSFDHNKLSNSNLNKKNSSFKPTNTIERIVIVGLTKQPSAITVNGKSLTFDYDKNLLKLTIRKPDLQIANDWEIQFN